MVEVKNGKAKGDVLDGIKDGTYYTMKEFSIIYNLKLATIRQWKKRGQIRTVSMLGRVLIPADQLPYDGKTGRPKKQKT